MHYISREDARRQPAGTVIERRRPMNNCQVVTQTLKCVLYERTGAVNDDQRSVGVNGRYTDF